MKGNRKKGLFFLIIVVCFGMIEIRNPSLFCMIGKDTMVKAAEMDGAEESSELVYTANIEDDGSNKKKEALSDEEEEDGSDEEADAKEDEEEEEISSAEDSKEEDFSQSESSKGSEEETDSSSLRPVYDEDTESTVYSCIYYGSYPQTQVTGERLTSDIINAKYDENGDAKVAGNRYRKVENVDGTSYFLYEPIKWKIIENVDGYIIAMAERGLDYCSYYEEKKSSKETDVNVQDLTDEELENYTDRRVAYDEVDWERSTLRSWLNSYGKDKNIAKKSYAEDGKGFFHVAFSQEEQQDMKKIQKLEDFEVAYYLAFGKGDKVTTLNYEGAMNEAYGFAGEKTATTGRILEATDYATEIGKELKDDFSSEDAWWIADYSKTEDSIRYVTDKGALKSKGTESYHSLLVRPVIIVDENSKNIQDAGQVSISNASGDSILVRLKADKQATLNEQLNGYKDATIEIFVKNIGTNPVQVIDATLEFDDGDKILDGKNNIRFSNINAGEEKNIAWKFAIKPQEKKVTATYTINVVGKNLATTCLKGEISIPRVVRSTKQDDSGTAETSTEQENKTFLQKLRDFFKGLS